MIFSDKTKPSSQVSASSAEANASASSAASGRRSRGCRRDASRPSSIRRQGSSWQRRPRTRRTSFARGRGLRASASRPCNLKKKKRHSGDPNGGDLGKDSSSAAGPASEDSVEVFDDGASPRPPQKAKQVWRKHVWVVLVIDLFVCLVLFRIWLWVCRGFKCINGLLVIAQGINARDVKKLQVDGIYTCNGLMMHTKKNSTGIKGLSEAKVDKICEAAEKIVCVSIWFAVPRTRGSRLRDL